MKSFIEYLLENSKINIVDDKIVPIKIKDYEQAMKDIADAFNNIRLKYTKCIAVLDALDPQAGSMSEKILAYLLTKYGSNKNITAEQVGGKQNLTDIKITIKGKTYNISLKTTSSKKSIGLGLDEKRVQLVLDKNFKEYIISQYELFSSSENKIHAATFVKDILTYFHGKNPEKDVLNKYQTSIKAKVDVIVEKLCGSELEPEIFIWIEKQYKKNKLSGLNFHMYRFNPEGVKDFLMTKCTMYFTENGAFGFKYNEQVVVGAENVGKVFNIKPYFITIASTDKTMTYFRDNKIKGWTITLVDEKEIQKISSILSKINTQSSKDIDAAYIEQLENIYNAIASKSSSEKTNEK